MHAFSLPKDKNRMRLLVEAHKRTPHSTVLMERIAKTRVPAIVPTKIFSNPKSPVALGGF
jgi:hypothetical protein